MSRPHVNAVGDLVLTDPEAMEALADPARLALLDGLRREGPATAVELAERMDATRDAIQTHLRELEAFGLVTPGDKGTRWSAVAKGFVFEIPEDPEGQAAARRLSNAMLRHYADLPGRWVADDEPRLPLDWVRAAGLFNARVTVTPEELRAIQEELERVLAPFITRESGEVPAEAGPVRVLSYFLPRA